MFKKTIPLSMLTMVSFSIIPGKEEKQKIETFIQTKETSYCKNNQHNARVLVHPLAHHSIAQLRNKNTPPDQFRFHTNTLATLLILESTYGIQLKKSQVETPLKTTECQILGQGLTFVPILRAGLSMIEPGLHFFSDVTIGYIGVERNEKTAKPRQYYCKLPILKGRYTICFDPMLATGGSASHSIKMIKEHGADQIVMVSIIASPEGIKRINKDHPDVSIVVGTVDECLNEKKYIIPGLGDFGDRLCGTL